MTSPPEFRALSMATILVVDDEAGIRALLSEILSDEGHAVEEAENALQARQFRERFRPDLVLLDIWMPDVDGITLLDLKVKYDGFFFFGHSVKSLKGKRCRVFSNLCNSQ